MKYLASGIIAILISSVGSILAMHLGSFSHPNESVNTIMFLLFFACILISFWGSLIFIELTKIKKNK